ncbi:MAG: GNAT family N-acetyltransferase [Phycisphaerales bacterium]|nr:MAG: GNAT family N-acetyltransferase [Phycisphaerales bacterium]
MTPTPPGSRKAMTRDALEIGTRVFLRKPTQRDCEEFLQRMRDSRRLHRGWVPLFTSAEQYETMLKHGRAENRLQSLICRIEDGAIVGQINLNEIVRGLTQSTYIGYHIFVPFDGKGYMTEGIELMLRHAFRTLKLHRVEAGIQPNNERSIELVKRLGFRYEGTALRLIKIAGRWRDHQRWAILAEEWRARRRPRLRTK